MILRTPMTFTAASFISEHFAATPGSDRRRTGYSQLAQQLKDYLAANYHHGVRLLYYYAPKTIVLTEPSLLALRSLTQHWADMPDDFFDSYRQLHAVRGLHRRVCKLDRAQASLPEVHEQLEEVMCSTDAENDYNFYWIYGEPRSEGRT